MEEVNPKQALKDYVSRYDTQGDAASALSVSQPYLSDLLRGNRTFSARLLKKLGLKRTVVTK